MGQIHGLEHLILESQATQPAVNTFFQWSKSSKLLKTQVILVSHRWAAWLYFPLGGFFVAVIL